MVDNNLLLNASAEIVMRENGFAKSLLSASFAQMIHGHFYWQLSDILTLVCSTIVIVNFILARLDKRRIRRRTQDQTINRKKCE